VSLDQARPFGQRMKEDEVGRYAEGDVVEMLCYNSKKSDSDQMVEKTASERRKGQDARAQSVATSRKAIESPNRQADQ
jgi:hypothetical protein